LAYATLSADDSCPPVGNQPPFVRRTGLVHTASVVPLKGDDLYSVVPAWPNFEGNGAEFADGIAKGTFGEAYGNPSSYRVESFNIANLVGPVPASPYFAATDDCWLGKRCATIIDDTYNPYIAVKQSVLAAVDPAWSACKHGLQGMYDPPRVLTAVNYIQTPQMPNFGPVDPMMALSSSGFQAGDAQATGRSKDDDTKGVTKTLPQSTLSAKPASVPTRIPSTRLPSPTRDGSAGSVKGPHNSSKGGQVTESFQSKGDGSVAAWNSSAFYSIRLSKGLLNLSFMVTLYPLVMHLSWLLG
jgi:hypothetical protein